MARLSNIIFIETKNSTLVFTIGENKKLYQVYLGEKLKDPQEYLSDKIKQEAYIPAGTDNVFEPAIRIVHSDGNPSLELLYIDSKTEKQNKNITHTRILLKDPVYPVDVALHFIAYYNEDIIKTWTEIRHTEKKPVVLTHFASSMLHFNSEKYYLTQFHGDWAKEMRIEDSQLTHGIKIIDSKLGTRPFSFHFPVFFLSFNNPSDEKNGELIAGTLAWTGNFQLLFEMDQNQSLRVISSMNPYASEYHLEPNKLFITPESIFTYSKQGRGLASRNLHQWARNYGVMDGTKSRYVLLNNWEATFFDFNEEKLVELFGEAHSLGVDLFLLDDGWFANKYPRNNDTAGLGDWDVNTAKLPHGLGYLVKKATEKGVKFGIWIEPEMVNPKSELYEKHPDWILKLPNREEHLIRTQLVLDLTNPKVQDFVYNVVDHMLTENPDIAYIKWDNNRQMTYPYSPYLKEKQSHLFIEYVRGFYQVMERLRKKYPHFPIMLCSSGGGRTDYGALKYFTEFWSSDNTGPYDRVFIQWGYSYFFPSNTICAHITSWGQESLKFRTDVAMMDKLGYDIRLTKMNDSDLEFSKSAIKLYKKLSDIIWFGDLYRLISPYDEDRAVLMYVDSDKKKAVLFSYNLFFQRGYPTKLVKLDGLDPGKKYLIKEVNLYPNTQSQLMENEKTFSGEYLMKVGLHLPAFVPLTSSVIELTVVK